MLGFKGFENKTDSAIWKAWSSDPYGPTAANFTFMGYRGPQMYGSATERGMQGYYMGTNLTRGGKEFANEAQFIYAWETYWDGYPGSAANPAYEHWWYFGGGNGTAGQRVMMIYVPINNPEQFSLEWSMDNMTFSNWADRRPYMKFTPSGIDFFDLPGNVPPKITT